MEWDCHNEPINLGAGRLRVAVDDEDVARHRHCVINSEMFERVGEVVCPRDDLIITPSEASVEHRKAEIKSGVDEGADIGSTGA